MQSYCLFTLPVLAFINARKGAFFAKGISPWSPGVVAVTEGCARLLLHSRSRAHFNSLCLRRLDLLGSVLLFVPIVVLVLFFANRARTGVLRRSCKRKALLTVDSDA